MPHAVMAPVSRFDLDGEVEIVVHSKRWDKDADEAEVVVARNGGGGTCECLEFRPIFLFTNPGDDDVKTGEGVLKTKLLPFVASSELHDSIRVSRHLSLQDEVSGTTRTDPSQCADCLAVAEF